MKLAFIGGGGHHYLRDAVSDAAIKIDRPVAVAGDGIDNERAQGFAASLGITDWFDDPMEMLDTVKPDIVSIGAVYAKNGELAAAALERDIKVVSDKPVATSWDVLHRLENIVRGTNRTLLTEFPFRAQPEFRAARAAVQAGAIGDVVLASAQKSYKFGTRPFWYADRALYGGTLLWVASHGIDAIHFTTGQELVCVSGRQGNLSQPDFRAIEDHTVSLFALGGGGTGIVHADYLRPPAAEGHGDDRLRLAGTRGVLEVRNSRCTLTSHDQAETDITNSVAVRPMYQELWAALTDNQSDLFSTAGSLETANLLLQARDKADNHSET